MSSIGKIIWTDLTIPNADEVRDFYSAVTGWTVQNVEMGDYSDYSMVAPDGTPGAGICHAAGVNSSLPPQWLVYVSVADLDASIAECQQRGGKVIVDPRAFGESRMCVIQDPAGAVAALFQEG